jgi:hypothetical protein
VIREEKFLISRAPYAVNLDSLKVEERGADSRRPYFHGRIAAAWFRRKSGVLTSHIGTLWDSQYERPADAAAFLNAHDDGRYGGDCIARWDGKSFWGNVTLDEQSNYLGILAPMLNNFPEVPRGFDGWYTFKTGGKP